MLFIKKQVLSVVTILIPIVLSTPSPAQEYFGIQLSKATFNDYDSCIKIEPTMIIIKAGRFLSSNLAIEGRVSPLGKDGKSSNCGRQVEYDIDLIGGYLVYSSDIGSKNKIYGLFGYTNIDATYLTDFDGEDGPNDAGGKNTSPSIGFGINLGNFKEATFNIEYVTYFSADKDDEFDVQAISVGIQF